jgi:tRNA(Ile)-lysidine synthase
MYLFADWAKRERAPLPAVLVVDHGLRPQSHAEAALTAQWAKDAGLTANVLCWRGKKPGANIEDRARAARYRLLGAWCAAQDVPHLFVAHTREDQAETFLLRLGRGSGVDGLSGMCASGPLPVSDFGTVRLLRPLLEIGREELRAYLRARGVHWLEDPMNADARFARARIRQALPELQAAGLPVERIARTASHLARARAALEAAAEEFFEHHGRRYGGFVLIDGAALARVPREIGLRALSRALMLVGGAVYRPRFESLETLFDGILGTQGPARTLMGCRIGKAPKARSVFGAQTLLISPEPPRKPALGAKPAGGAHERINTTTPCENSRKSAP